MIIASLWIRRDPELTHYTYHTCLLNYFNNATESFSKTKDLGDLDCYSRHSAIIDLPACFGVCKWNHPLHSQVKFSHLLCTLAGPTTQVEREVYIRHLSRTSMLSV